MIQTPKANQLDVLNFVKLIHRNTGHAQVDQMASSPTSSLSSGITQGEADLIPGLFNWDQPLFVARAPGRLDVMGGIADYSGSLVLQVNSNGKAQLQVVDHC